MDGLQSAVLADLAGLHAVDRQRKQERVAT